MPGTTPRYPPEVKSEAVWLVRSSEKSLSMLAKELGVSDNSLRSWVKQAEIDEGNAQGLTTDEREEPKRLRRENNKVLKQERNFLKKALRPSSPGRMGLDERF